MASYRLLASLLLLSCVAHTCHGALFSSLRQSLLVTASHNQEILKAGEDEITVTWGLNQTFSDAGYTKIKVQLCYAPISQKDRAWRRTLDDLSKDKTCQFDIVDRAYTSSSQSYKYTIQRDVPTATYFVRAYAYDSQEEEVAYGQNTDAKHTTNLFQVQAVSGRHLTLDICSAVFSAFSVLSLFGFFVAEKRKAKASPTPNN